MSESESESAEMGAAIIPGDRSGLLEAGELVLLHGPKHRRYLLTLDPEKEFHSHSGVLAHTELIGTEEGIPIRTSFGVTYRCFRLTLSDYVFKMPRGAQVIYPKDLGPILMLADIYPGVRVLESGVGSGALSMAMLRAGANIVGYELREDFAARAQENVQRFLGDVSDRYRVELRNCYEGIEETRLDRVVLDLPEPWQVVPHAATALRPGGIFVAYTPSIVQVIQLKEALEDAGFMLIETLEVLQRTWHVENPAVRPDHRMVAHTAFLTHARWSPPGDDFVPPSVVARQRAEALAAAGLDPDADGPTPFRPRLP